MHDEALDDQRDLVERIEEAGWQVTDAELSVYESPWADDTDPEATVTITARKVYPTDQDDESPYRLK